MVNTATPGSFGTMTTRSLIDVVCGANQFWQSFVSDILRPDLQKRDVGAFFNNVPHWTIQFSWASCSQKWHERFGKRRNFLAVPEVKTSRLDRECVCAGLAAQPCNLYGCNGCNFFVWLFHVFLPLRVFNHSFCRHSAQKVEVSLYSPVWCCGVEVVFTCSALRIVAVCRLYLVVHLLFYTISLWAYLAGGP